MTVSPGRGSGEPKAAKSALMLPTTATPLRSSMSARSPFFCELLAHRAWIRHFVVARRGRNTSALLLRTALRDSRRSQLCTHSVLVNRTAR